MARAGLSTRKVVEEAAAVADDVGWDRLSLAEVASRFGVRLPSLYKHIASLDALRTEVSVLCLAELTQRMTDAVLGRSGTEALLALADAYRDYGREHPGRYLATVAAPRGDHPGHEQAAAAALRVIEAVLAGYGLVGDDAVDAVRALRAAVHGFVHLETSGAFALPVETDRSYRRLVEGIDTAMRTWASAG